MIETPLAPAEIRKRLAGAIGPMKVVGGTDHARPFEGAIRKHTFRIERVTVGTHRYFIRIRGRILRRSEGGGLDLTVSLHPYVLVLLAVLSLVTLVATVHVGLPMLVEDRWDRSASFPLVLLAMIWALVTASFNGQTKKTRALLNKLMEPPTGWAGDESPGP